MGTVFLLLKNLSKTGHFFVKLRVVELAISLHQNFVWVTHSKCSIKRR